MPVAPDMLLRPAAQATAQPAPTKRPEASHSEASDFSEVYAKERQNRPAASDEKSAEASAPSAEGQSPIADGGKDLPQDAAADQEPLESQLLEESLGAASDLELAAEDEAPEIDSTLLPFALLPPITGNPQPQSFKLGSSLTAQGSGEVPGGIGAQDKAASSTLDMALKTAAQPAETEALALQSLADEQPADTEAGLESLLDTPTDSTAGKLSALTQALPQPISTAPRSTLIPGQPVAMQQGGWSEAVVDRVMWLSSQNLKSAEIQLDPQELGRLDVRINLQGDQTQVIFASAHAGVRDALESQMHRLREMFVQQGLNQLDVSVSDQSHRGSPGQTGEGAQGAARRDSFGTEDELPAAAQELSQNVARGRGLVDFYA